MPVSSSTCSTDAPKFLPDQYLNSPDSIKAYFSGRLNDAYLRQRLQLEADIEYRAERRKKRKRKLIDWLISPWLVHSALRAVLLHDRARRNALDIQVRHNILPIARLSSAFEGFTVLHLSDLHADMNAAFPDALCRRLDGLDYDLCVLTGDYRYLIHGPPDDAINAMRTICAKFTKPAYGILGNHDPLALAAALEQFGVRILLNEAAELKRGGDSLWLLGVDDPHLYRTDALERARITVPNAAATLLLAHTPAFYRAAQNAGIGAMLCGHTHGGQICLPGGVPLVFDVHCPRHMISGSWRAGALHGYTSAGAGTSIADVRLNCPPEITLHRLQRA